MNSLLFLAVVAAGAPPPVELPASYRDAANVTWSAAAPADTATRGEWWTVFNDAALERLERLALTANQDLRAAAARVEQSRAAAGFARGSYWPQLAGNGSVTRERTSATTENVFPDPLTTTYRAPLTLSWEIDLFGRVRHLSASAAADAAATAATFEAVRLALSSDVAANYFALRAVERETALVRDTVELRRRALELVRSRQTIGTAADLDVARAEGELAGTEADAAALAIRRATLQNALAVLVGAAAPAFDLPAATAALGSELPSVPAGLPATLLERRPDIAAAERTVLAAQERIGVAKAAFFPAISLTGSAGFASGDIDRLFTTDSRAWSIGPALYLPIFQGGRNRANLERSRAAQDEAVANYRQRVLNAFREVQDALTASQLLEAQSAAQDRAVAAARRAASLAQTRYDAGYVSYLDVIDAQRTALAAERTEAQLRGVRFNTRVALIRALGGGWHVPSSYAAQ
jgi:multidrug efflux system outer membrane protein